MEAKAEASAMDSRSPKNENEANDERKTGEWVWMLPK